MHGHNYTVGARIGARSLQPDGYVIDFGDVKKVLRQICKRSAVSSGEGVAVVESLSHDVKFEALLNECCRKLMCPLKSWEFDTWKKGDRMAYID